MPFKMLLMLKLFAVLKNMLKDPYFVVVSLKNKKNISNLEIKKVKFSVTREQGLLSKLKYFKLININVLQNINTI